MNSAPRCYLVDGFLVKLSKEESSLSIEAQDLTKSINYFKKVRESDVKKITDELFSDIKGMYQGLDNALHGTFNDISVSMKKDGVLVYHYQPVQENVNNEFKFEIPLDEVKPDPYPKLEEQLRTITEKLARFENALPLIQASFAEKEDIGRMILDRLSILEKKVEDIEIRLDCPRFDPQGYNSSSFIYSNGDRKVTKATSLGWSAVFAKKPIKRIGESRFSVKLRTASESLGYTCVMIGLAPSMYLKSATCDYSEGCYFYCSKGSIIANGKELEKEFPKSRQGSVVTVVANFEEGIISFEVEGSQVFETGLDKFKHHEYYPCVQLYFSGDSVSFTLDL